MNFLALLAPLPEDKNFQIIASKNENLSSDFLAFYSDRGLDKELRYQESKTILGADFPRLEKMLLAEHGRYELHEVVAQHLRLQGLELPKTNLLEYLSLANFATDDLPIRWTSSELLEYLSRQRVSIEKIYLPPWGPSALKDLSPPSLPLPDFLTLCELTVAHEQSAFFLKVKPTEIKP